MSKDSFLPGELEALQQVYTDLDRSMAQLRLATGLRCPDGCGACCLRPSREVEATVLEMIPLALNLHREGSAEVYYREATEAGGSHPCILYLSRREKSPWGKCERYDHRPLVCRLFGSSALTDKSGKLRIAASKIMKEADPGLISRAEALLPQLEEVPRMEDSGRKVASLHPGLGVERLPLNTALAKALEWVHLRWRWSADTSDVLGST